jgi:hypothetical protein
MARHVWRPSTLLGLGNAWSSQIKRYITRIFYFYTSRTRVYAGGRVGFDKSRHRSNARLWPLEACRDVSHVVGTIQCFNGYSRFSLFSVSLTMRCFLVQVRSSAIVRLRTSHIRRYVSTRCPTVLNVLFYSLFSWSSIGSRCPLMEHSSSTSLFCLL